jgi:hypothetical protein
MEVISNILRELFVLPVARLSFFDLIPAGTRIGVQYSFGLPHSDEVFQ